MGVQMASMALQSVPVSGPDLTWLTIFVGVIAVCVLGITLGLLGALIAVLRVKSNLEKQLAEMKRKAEPMIGEVKSKVEPIIGSVQSVVDDLKPKIKAVSDDVVELSHMVRAQATDLDSTLSDVQQKARSQVNRVNGFVNSTLETTATVASNVEKGIRVPIREFAGLVNGVKAGVEVLFQRRDERRGTRRAGTRGNYGERFRGQDAASGQGYGQGPYGAGGYGGRETVTRESYAGSVPSGVERQVHMAAAAAERDAAERAREGKAAESNVATLRVPDAGTASEGHGAGRAAEPAAAPEVVTGSLPESPVDPKV